MLPTSKIIGALVVLACIVVSWWLVRGRGQFPLPSGETVSAPEAVTSGEDSGALPGGSENEDGQSSVSGSPQATESGSVSTARSRSTRSVLVTDGTKHSIPLGEILSGGPRKDGIPSIDDPKFVAVATADKFLEDADPGIGLSIEGEHRFYPYLILVWHEIVNDTFGGTPVLVTYCPLCATGIVFERRVSGEAQEFGVSGRLWQSNLLMYNRTGSEATESLWSQVLGEAVLGPATGERLTILPSDIVRWGEWKKLHPNTEALSKDTGTLRNYGLDPYGGYYTSRDVSFGADFRDTRLHPKALVVGIEIEGRYKAYHVDAIAVGETRDGFAGREVVVTKDASERISVSADGVVVPHVPGFWFSWIAVHPNTELFK